MAWAWCSGRVSPSTHAAVQYVSGGGVRRGAEFPLLARRLHGRRSDSSAPALAPHLRSSAGSRCRGQADRPPTVRRRRIAHRLPYDSGLVAADRRWFGEFGQVGADSRTGALLAGDKASECRGRLARGGAEGRRRRLFQTSASPVVAGRSDLAAPTGRGVRPFKSAIRPS